MRVRILNSNTHAGQGLREGGLLKCAKELDADIVTVQEVQRPSARLRLRRQFPQSEWGIYGMMPPSLGPSAAGNHVLWKKSMFIMASGLREFLSPQLYDGMRRDKWHPSRRICQVRLHATKAPMLGTRLAVGSDHLWTTAGRAWTQPWDRVVAGHRQQAQRQAEVAWGSVARGYDVVHLGDENAVVAPGDRHEAYVELMYNTHGMRNARPPNATKASLDAAWVSRDVQVVSFDWIPKHLLTTDHEGILLVVDI